MKFIYLCLVVTGTVVISVLLPNTLASAATAPDNCYTITGSTITGYQDTGDCPKDLDIPEEINNVEITAIGDYAFYSAGLTEVSIPSTVTLLGDYAFTENELQSITIPDSVESIGDRAFGDNQLTSATLSSSLSALPADLFINNRLVSITIPSSVVSIEAGVFLGNQLDSVSFSSSLRSIGDQAFYENELETITLPNSLESIGGQAFYGNRLISLTIPNSVTVVDTSAFSDNELTSLTLSSSLTVISYGAFSGSKLRAVAIPSSVTSIEPFAFFSNQLTTVHLPESLQSIEYGAFMQNELQHISLPQNLQQIGGEAFENNYLQTLTVPQSVKSIGAYAFSDNVLQTVTILGNPSLGDKAFAYNGTKEKVSSSSWYEQNVNANIVQIYSTNSDFITANSNGVYAAPDYSTDDVNDGFIVGAYIVNPAYLQISNIDTESNVLGPSRTIVGRTSAGEYIYSFSLSHISESVAITGLGTERWSDVSATADFSSFFAAGQQVIAPVQNFAGYSTPLQRTVPLQTGENRVEYVYAMQGQSANDDESEVVAPDTGLQLLTYNLLPIITAALLLCAVLLRCRFLKKKLARLYRV